MRQVASLLQTKTSHKKWRENLFSHALNLSVVAAFKFYNEANKSKVTHLEFRWEIAKPWWRARAYVIALDDRLLHHERKCVTMGWTTSLRQRSKEDASYTWRTQAFHASNAAKDSTSHAVKLTIKSEVNLSWSELRTTFELYEFSL